MSSSISEHTQTITSMADVSEGTIWMYAPATEFAPKGRIIDDSARGTIFWEATLPEKEENEAYIELSLGPVGVLSHESMIGIDR